jgi:hypothetical protein
MTLQATEASHFYYYGRPTSEVKNPTYPSGKRIITQFPPNMAKTRIVWTLVWTVIFCGSTHQVKWRWAIAILGMAFASYTAYRHLLTKDPLVEALYKIAGGEKAYQALPELKPKEKQNRTYEYADQVWSKLEHPMYRFLTKDGRNGLLVKGLSYLKTLPFLLYEGVSASNTQKIMIFVEKLDSTDISPSSNNVPKWVADVVFGVGKLC